MNTPKPALINVIAWTTLTSGIVNLFWGIAALSTFIGFICAPFSILPIVLGIFELIYAAKLFSNPPQPVQPSNKIAVFEIACVLIGNVFAMAVGILALIFYNDMVVKEYFTRLNGTFSQPASIPQPKPASANEKTGTQLTESTSPSQNETSSKP